MSAPTQPRTVRVRIAEGESCPLCGAQDHEICWWVRDGETCTLFGHWFRVPLPERAEPQVIEGRVGE